MAWSRDATSRLQLDVAASHFYNPASGTYHLTAAGDDVLDAAGMTAMLTHWAKLYPIVSIEDGLAEDDWTGWSALTKELGSAVQLIGDDLFATQTTRLHQGIEQRAGNAILIKVNQVGTLSETFAALLLRASQWLPNHSSRPGRVRPRTRPSPTWLLPPPPAKSRSARSPARSGSPSTTGSSGSRMNLARPPASPATPPCERRSPRRRTRSQPGPRLLESNQ